MNRRALLEKNVINLYETKAWKKWFAKIRIWEAPCWEVEKLIPQNGLILDLGCGEGVFSNLWALSSKSRKIVGIDKNSVRVNQAKSGLDNIKFIKGNIMTINFPRSDAIVIFHVLHHLSSFKDQENLIKKCFKSLVKKGKIIIIEVDIKTNTKYLISWLTDHFVAPLLFDHKIFDNNIYYRPKKNWLNLLKTNGFITKSFAVEKNKPFTNLVIEGIKK